MNKFTSLKNRRGGGGQRKHFPINYFFKQDFSAHLLFEQNSDIINSIMGQKSFKTYFAFTMAEVLITLGIIGVVASITLPALVQNYQKHVLKNQYKKAYANFYNAIKLTQAKLDYPLGCSYWEKNIYGGGATCDRWHPDYNNCTHWTMPDGSPLPSDYNGPRYDCAAFEETLFNQTLKTIKFCNTNALTNGCVTDKYRGVDKVKDEQNPDAEYKTNPDDGFSDSNIKVKYSSWVLSDGTVIMKYGKYKANYPIYTIDINGHKGPNKWGYDLFTFRLRGTETKGITILEPLTYATEKDGFTGSQMQLEMNK